MLDGSAHYLADVGYIFPELPISITERSSVWTSSVRHNCVAATYADFESAFEVLSPREAGQFWRDIKRSKKTSILSAEDFSRQVNFLNLKKAMTDIEIDVVVYLRRQDKYLESLYNQRNKILVGWGDTNFLTEDLLTERDLFKFAADSGYIDILDYNRLLTRIQRELSPAKIYVRPFDRSQFESGDVCVDFCKIIGLDPKRMTIQQGEANRCIGNRRLSELRSILRSEGKAAAISAMQSINNSEEDFSGEYTIFSSATRSELLRQYEAINIEISRKFGVTL